MMTSPLLYKLTKLARRCQWWPLVPDQDIICLCLWSQPSYRNCAARHRKIQCTPSLPLLPLAHWAIAYRERGQREGTYWHYLRPGKVWGFSLDPSEDIYPGCLQKPGLPAFIYFCFSVPMGLCCVYSCGPAEGVSPGKRG